MKILDRYVASQMLMPFLFGVAAFTCLFVSSDLLRLAGMVVELGAPVGAVARVFFLQLPQVIVLTLPMSVLLATLLALSRLSATSEIVAMRAGGLSFWRYTAPIFVIAACVSVVAFGVNEWIVPKSNLEAERVMAEEVRGRPLPSTQNNLQMWGSDSTHGVWTLYAQRFDSREQIMENLVFTRLSGGRPVETTAAKRAVWDNDMWYMEGAESYLFGGDAGVITVSFSELRQPLDIGQSPEQIALRNRDPDQMSLVELREYVAELREQGADVRELEVQLHLKYSLPAASLVFALIAAPLGVQSHRSSTSTGFGMSIVIIFIYYVLMTVGTALGQAGTIPPLLGAWIQNIAVGGTGVFLMIRQGR